MFEEKNSKLFKTLENFLVCFLHFSHDMNYFLTIYLSLKKKHILLATLELTENITTLAT